MRNRGEVQREWSKNEEKRNDFNLQIDLLIRFNFIGRNDDINIYSLNN